MLRACPRPIRSFQGRLESNQFQTTMSLTTSPVSKEICDRLKRLASNGETYDDRLIEDAEARLLREREKRILETEEFIPSGTRCSRGSPWKRHDGIDTMI